MTSDHLKGYEIYFRKRLLLENLARLKSILYITYNNDYSNLAIRKLLS
jgi:hypothetical protein